MSSALPPSALPPPLPSLDPSADILDELLSSLVTDAAVAYLYALTPNTFLSQSPLSVLMEASDGKSCKPAAETKAALTASLEPSQPLPSPSDSLLASSFKRPREEEAAAGAGSPAAKQISSRKPSLDIWGRVPPKDASLLQLAPLSSSFTQTSRPQSPPGVVKENQGSWVPRTSVLCPNCGRKTAAAKLAQHLDKCQLTGGRTAGRSSK